MQMIRRHRKLLFCLLIAAAVFSLPGLWLLDYFDIPSTVIRGTRKAYLTLRPVVVTDEEILSPLAAWPACPDKLKQAIEAKAYATAWEAYRELRSKHLTSTLVVDPKTKARLLQELKRRYPQELEKLLAKADEYAADVLAPFDMPLGVLGKDWTWTNFPPSPEADARIFLWEYNTLQHFTLLAQAYLFTSDPKYFDAITRHLDSWIAENPIENSVIWPSGLESSLRLYTLTWTGEMLADDERMKDIFPRLMKIMYAHARFVFKEMNRVRKTNNHRILQTLGLYSFAVNYPELAASARWKEYAEQALLAELELQYTPNGVQGEFAPTYHLILLDTYLHYLLMKRKLHEPVPESVLDRLARQLRFLRDVTAPDGEVFLIGDSDDHHVLRLVVDHYANARPTLHLGALLLHDTPAQAPADRAAWEVTWLLGPQLYEQLASKGLSTSRPSPPTEPRMHVYRHAGFVRINSGDTALLADFTRLGDEDFLGGHNHCDITSFLLWYGEYPVVIDPGTYTYRSSTLSHGVVWRKFMRSAQAHNTTSVDGRSQVEHLEDFRWGTWPEAQLLFAASDGDFFAIGGEHLAYQDVVGRSVRVFVIQANTVLVIDWFPEAVGQHTYETNVVLGQPDATLDNEAVRLPNALLQWAALPSTEVQLLEGSYDPPGGWRSPSYGTLIPTPQWRARTTMDGPAVCAFQIDLVGAEPPHTSPTVPVLTTLPDGQFAVSSTAGQGDLIVLLNSAEDPARSPLRHGDWVTDARIAVIETGPQRRAAVFEGTYLRQGEQDIKAQIVKRLTKP